MPDDRRPQQWIKKQLDELNLRMQTHSHAPEQPPEQT